jgi:N-carbamoyl-L-amino-acid hydrolase
MAVLSKIAVNGDRLIESINRLAAIGRLPEGSIRRLAFTPEDLQARNLVRRWMEDAGMSVHTDAVGNIIGRYGAQPPDAPALATGSHIDTVPSGGCYDGTLGVLAGLEVVRTLRDQRITLRHPLEVIVFTDEESSMIGSRGMAGTVNELKAISVADQLEKVGGDWDQMAKARRDRSQIAAFVELHVEQGGVLEAKHKEIGVVQGVVGMYRYKIALEGRANHAGTTPMDLRQDALIAAAQIVLMVQQLALNAPGDPVATVGMLTVSPNAANIVPGEVQLTVDMRDLSTDTLNQMAKELYERVEAIATVTNTPFQITPILQVAPTPATENIQRAIEQTAQELGMSYCALPSRAGHDAMEMGRITDMGMIFVPSQGGVSHSGDEYTTPEQCIQGANVLLHTLLRLDEQYTHLDF